MRNFTRTCCLLMTASALPLLAAPAQAQETSEVSDVIVVEGIRSSLLDARNAKREASQIVDVVSAEDIGKLPDTNIAESLQRVTGVQIDREAGEGTGIRIRGLEQVLLLVDGRTVQSNDEDRNATLEGFPSELFGKVEVYKSPTADLIEGGVGGTVLLSTRKPLDFNERTIAYSVEGVYSDLAEEYGYELSAMWTDKFLDDSLGLLLAVSYGERDLRTDILDTQSWRSVDIDVDGDTVTESLRGPRNYNAVIRNRERESLGITGSVQWAPTDDLNLYLDGTYTQLNDDFTSIAINNGNILGNGSALVGPFVTEGDSLLQYTRSGITRPTIGGTDEGKENETYIIGVGGDWSRDALTVSADIAYSFATQDDDFIGLNAGPASPTDVTVNFVGSPTIDFGSFDYTNQANFNVPGGHSNLNVETPSEEFSARLDFDYEVDNSFFTSFEAGLRYADSSIERERTFRESARPAEAGNPISNFPEIFQPVSFSNFLDGEAGGLPDVTEFAPVISRAREDELRTLLGLAPRVFDPNSSFDIDEEILAGYVKANFAGEAGVPFSGNVGVRVAQTDLTAGGFAVVSRSEFTPVTDEQSYTDVLPSANISFDVTDEWKVRIAAAEVLARPDTTDLRRGFSFIEDTASGTGTASGGNPELDPFRATQLDLSIEYYFGETGLFTIAGFYKDVESFTQTEVITDITLPGTTEGILFDLTRPVNGEGGTIEGFEIAYQQTFDFLPAPFDGLGFTGNYTYTKSDSGDLDPDTNEALPLEQLSENSLNLIPFYEKGPFGIRIAYNWRDEFLIQTSNPGGSPEYVKDRGQLDLSASYDVSDKISLTLDALNLTREEEINFQSVERQLVEYSIDDRRIFFGIRGKL